MSKTSAPAITAAERRTAQAIAVRTNSGDAKLMYNVHDHMPQATIADEVHNWDPNVRTVLVDVTRLTP